MPVEPVGKVTRYWPRAACAEIVIEDCRIAIGDRIEIRGATYTFEESVESLQGVGPRGAVRASEPLALTLKCPAQPGDEVRLLRAPREEGSR